MLHDVSLADRFDLTKEWVQLSGSQAVVRLTLMQRARDAALGRDTAGYVTGYRGSPLGGLDQQFQRAAAQLDAANILFHPALNEDIGAAALWGTQQAEMRGEGRHEGVFGLWYGKGPGVDRSGDVLRHANLAGTSRLGGVVALMGDDHTCESSTTAHQSEFAFVDAMIPILSPAGVQEIIDFGLHGWEMSRFSGLWAGIKCVKDTVESTATVHVASGRFAPVPVAFTMPPGGLGIRPNDHPIAQEERLHRYKIDAALAYIRAQRLDRVVRSGGDRPRIGIVSAGKSFLDVEQALQELGLDEVELARMGVATYKIACTWPLEPQGIRAFSKDLELLIVVEEKRSLIEAQTRDILYSMPARPRVVGKIDEEGRPLLQTHGALDINDIAIVIGKCIADLDRHGALAERLRSLETRQKSARQAVDIANRTPYFCAGCPHNSSTVVPEGSRAYAGIGCHYMSQWMDRSTEGHTHMGGEGANWIGEAHFSKRDHVFQNMGDGTYNHSGLLAIRAAKAAGVNITYKILFNDAVAMTGGQRHEGGLTVDAIARQVAAEGAARIALVTDEPDKYTSAYGWPDGLTIHHRSDLDAVQRSLREVKGLSVLIYDQTCAAEKRRRRKRGEMVDPAVRVFINDLVCEGCGDCGAKSNCVAVVPIETALGRKRAIDQSACNKDTSCVQGFCPSFVTIEGGEFKPPAPNSAAAFDGPMPPEPQVALDRLYSIVLTGVGGTGVVTVGALLAMAAHVEGKGSAIIDMAGLAQKGGAVMSHIRLAPKQEDIRSVRVAAGGADLLLACDVVIAGTQKALATISPGKTRVVMNSYLQYPGDLTRNPDLNIRDAEVRQEIDKLLGPAAVAVLNATAIAQERFGDGMFGNVLLLGYAFQLGALPLSLPALERAIELNGSAVARNLEAFRLGRRLAAQDSPPAKPADTARTLAQVVDHRVAFLTQYQNAAYARRYRAAVERIADAEAVLGTGSERLAAAVATNLFRLMAYKDEYEVARLYASTGFVAGLRANFRGDTKVRIHLAPPGLTRTDPATGRPSKIAVGSWILPVFRLLAVGKRLRGTALDPFGYTHERRTERALVEQYFATIDELCHGLTVANLDVAVAVASTPEKIRGYGYIKERAIEAAQVEYELRISSFRDNVAATAAKWPAAGFVDTEIGCLTELEIGNAEKEVQPRVQA